jgi:hypothetical protein
MERTFIKEEEGSYITLHYVTLRYVRTTGYEQAPKTLEAFLAVSGIGYHWEIIERSSSSKYKKKEKRRS